MNPAVDLKAALTDVRRAYRLVYAYQRRVFDLVGAMAEPIEAAGFELDRWEPALYAMPSRAFYKPDKWAWDFLPGYAFSVAWNRNRPGDARKALISVASDTGFDRRRAEPDPADFIPADKALSELRLTLYRSETPAAWDRIPAIEAEDGTEQTLDLGGVQCRVRRIRVDLAELADEPIIDRRLLAPIRQWIAS